MFTAQEFSSAVILRTEIFYLTLHCHFSSNSISSVSLFLIFNKILIPKMSKKIGLDACVSSKSVLVHFFFNFFYAKLNPNERVIGLMGVLLEGSLIKINFTYIK